jgi:hypothetical protein
VSNKGGPGKKLSVGLKILDAAEKIIHPNNLVKQQTIYELLIIQHYIQKINTNKPKNF